MSVILGSGEHRYRVVENWAKLPEGWEFKDAAAVACDSKDRVYVFNRGEHPMIVFDREGNFLKSWGEGQYPRAHGLHIDANDILYLTDDAGHVVRKCTTDGKVLLELGVPGKPAPYMSGEPFHRCTHTALSPKGEIYVSDGYGNARVHKYSPDGKLHPVLGRAGHRCRAVQHRAQHRHRRRGLGLRRRPREPPRAGVRRQRQVRDAVGQHAPALRPVLLPRHARKLQVHHRRARAGHEREPAASQPRAAPDDRRRQGQDASRGWAARRARAWKPASSSRRTAWRWIRAATSTSARSATRSIRAFSRTARFPGACVRCRSWRKSPELAHVSTGH